MLKKRSLLLAVVCGVLAMASAAEAGGWYSSGFRAVEGPYLSRYSSRTVINPPGRSLYIARSRGVGPSLYSMPPMYSAPMMMSPVYSTGPVYPAGVGYQFTPYYYPVYPVHVAPLPITVYDYGW